MIELKIEVDYKGLCKRLKKENELLKRMVKEYRKMVELVSLEVVG